jgi:hypothetical protein
LQRFSFSLSLSLLATACSPFASCAGPPTEPASLAQLEGQLSFTATVTPVALSITLSPLPSMPSTCPQIEPAVGATANGAPLELVDPGGGSESVNGYGETTCGVITYELALDGGTLDGSSLHVVFAQDEADLEATADQALVPPSVALLDPDGGQLESGESLTLQVAPESATIAQAHLRFAPADGGVGFALDAGSEQTAKSRLTLTVPAGVAGAGRLFVDQLILNADMLTCAEFASCRVEMSGFPSPSVSVTVGP